MTFTGGGRYGESYFSSFNATYPFGRLRVEAGSITLRVWPFRTFRFDRSQITEIATYRGTFSLGVRIKHSIESYPPFIVFWTFNLKGVKADLLASGYALADSQTQSKTEFERSKDSSAIRGWVLTFFALLNAMILNGFVYARLFDPNSFKAFLVTGLTFVCLDQIFRRAFTKKEKR